MRLMFTSRNVNSIAYQMSDHRWPVYALAACWLTALLAVGQVREADVPKAVTDATVSASEQFRIYGSDQDTRGKFAAFLEHHKESFLDLLNVDDEWEHPIVVRVSGKVTDLVDERPIGRSLVYYDGNFGLEIKVRLCSSFTREGMREAALEMLMFERALQDAVQVPEDDPVPRWLKEGIPGALKLRREGRPSGFFASMVRLGIVPSAVDLLESSDKEADSVSRTIFRASASGLVLMLLDQQEGPDKLAKFIRDLGSPYSTSQRNLLARYFPALRGKEERMEQQWALYCMKLASPQALDFLSPEATEAHIVDALKVSFLEFVREEVVPENASAKKRKRGLGFGKIFGRGNKKGAEANEDKGDDAPMGEAETEEAEGEAVAASESATDVVPTQRFDGTVMDFERFIRRKDLDEILVPVRHRLLELSFRSFPSYRKLIQDYLELVRKLRAGDTRDLENKLKALAADRETLSADLKEVKDYLNWFEVTQLQQKNGAFREYLQRAKELEGDLRPHSDVLSQYIDLIEAELK